MELTIYLAGHIHDQWRSELQQKAAEKNLPFTFVGPQDNHDRSDSIGEDILGPQPNAILFDEAASQINNLRTRVLLHKADVVVALFGEKYKQWNTAMDASAAIHMGKPVILVRNPDQHHALKELANRSQVVVENVDQALAALAYIVE